MKCKNDEYCDMFLTLNICNGRTGTDPRQYALRHPGPRVSTVAAACLWHKKCNTVLMNEGRSWTVRKPGNAYVVISVVGWELWKNDCDITRELELFPNEGPRNTSWQLIGSTRPTRGTRVCFRTIARYTYRTFNGEEPWFNHLIFCDAVTCISKTKHVTTYVV